MPPETALPLFVSCASMVETERPPFAAPARKKMTGSLMAMANFHLTSRNLMACFDPSASPP
jgi:hypothetical protein